MNRRNFLQALIGSVAGLITTPSWGWLAANQTEGTAAAKHGQRYLECHKKLMERTVFPQAVTRKNGETWTHTFTIQCDQKGNMTVEEGVFDIVTNPLEDTACIGIG